MPSPNKNGINEQFARTAVDGTLDRSYTLTTDKGSAPLVDDNGRLIVRTVAAGPGPSTFTEITGAAGTNPGTDQVVLNVGPAVIDKLIFYHTAVAPRFFQIHDAAAVVAPAAVPLLQIQAQGNFTVHHFDLPVSVTTGLVVAFSTAELTFVVGPTTFSIFGSIYT